MKKYIILSALLSASIQNSYAQKDQNLDTKAAIEDQKMVVKQLGGPVTPHTTVLDLRTLPEAKYWRPGDGIKEVPKRSFGSPKKSSVANLSFSKDKLVDLQSAYSSRANNSFSRSIINVDGQGFSGVNPADPTLDIGKNYAIQAINDPEGSKFIILDKSNGTKVAGPLSMGKLGTGECATGAGDPIVLYDESASRWFIQEFSDAGNFLCIYISKTENPVTGGWHHYAYSDTVFPDYPHYGIWNNAYVGGANNNTRPVYAFDRENMLKGETARPVQKFSLSTLEGFGFQLATPADWDLMPTTKAPPEGSPAVLMRHVDEEAHANSAGENRADKDYLELFEFKIDWDDPSNSGVKSQNIDITDFNSCFNNLSDFGTVQQPNSDGLLDAIREAILNRLQYVNFGTHEAIVGVLPTNITEGCTPVQSALRWFELRRVGGLSGSWALHQEGTYANNSSKTENRLVGSISLDSAGNMALAYNLTDTSTETPKSAGINYTGRLANDPLGVMSQKEALFVEGNGANTSERWGDYASMAVDPIDGCTYWFTGVYQDGTNWNTRISSVKFDACGEPGYYLSSPETTLDFCTAKGNASKTSKINLNSVAEFTGNTTLSFSPSLPEGITGSFSNNPAAIGNVVDATFNVSSSLNNGSYPVSIQGELAGLDNEKLDLTLNISNSSPSATQLSSPFSSAQEIDGDSVTFQWKRASFATSYQIEVATDSSFKNLVINKTVSSNKYKSSIKFDSGKTYFWRVKATNICGTGAVSNTFDFTTSIVTVAEDICFKIDKDIPGEITGLDAIGDVTKEATLKNLDVLVKATHPWVGDLKVSLSHGDKTVVLMDQLDEGGCNGKNIDAIFKDGRENPVTKVCKQSGTAVDGVVNPEKPLSAFSGDSLNGQWTLNVVDNYPEEDKGTLNEFCLKPTLISKRPDFIFSGGFENN